MHMMHGSCWPIILMIIFWIGLFSLGVFLLSNIVSGANKKTTSQIIKERLTKGEIDEAEYERLESIIKKDCKK